MEFIEQNCQQGYISKVMAKYLFEVDSLDEKTTEELMSCEILERDFSFSLAI